jgi:hypothetical protein
LETTGAISGAGTANPLEHLSSPLVLRGVYVAQSLVFFVMFYRSLFILFLLLCVSSVFLSFTASDFIFGIVKLFNLSQFNKINEMINERIQ